MILNFFNRLFAGYMTIIKDIEREVLDKKMVALVKDAVDRVSEGGKWNFSSESAAAQAVLLDLYDEVLLGHATLQDFKAACRRWEDSGRKVL